MSKNVKHAYESLKDGLPESSSVMMAKAVFGSEELEEVIVEMAEDPVLADITHKQLCTADIEAIEKATIGQSGNENWKLYQKGKITASIIFLIFFAWSGYGYFLEITLLVFSLYKKYKFYNGSMAICLTLSLPRSE